MTKQEVIKRLLPKAKELRDKFGLHVSMTLAQIIQESGWLKNAPGNNFLGIKAPTDDNGNVLPSIPKDRIQYLWTTEYVNGKWIKVQCWFMNYPTLEDCMDRYAIILLLDRYKQTLESKDWWDSTNFVRLNGYATSPNYTISLRTLILNEKLYELDWFHGFNEDIIPGGNFQWGESFSNVFFNGKKYYNVIEPYREYWQNVINLAMLLQTCRDYAKAPMTVNRWFSIPDYNAYIGGAKGSQHLYALAADCAKPITITIGQFFDFVKKSIAIGIGVGKYYLHIDIRKGLRLIWYY